MDLLEKMKNDMVTAMKEKDKDRLSVLRMVKGAMQLESINNKKEINEELFIEVVSKQIKQRNESLAEFERANRIDLVENVKKEITILKEYLPEQLSEEEIRKIIAAIFEEVKPVGQKDMGKIMKEVTPKVKGKADMKLVSEIIKEKLNA